MVRLKNRYLLLDILYPEPASWPQGAAAVPRPGPDPSSSNRSNQAQEQAQAQTRQIYIHAPTSDALTPGLLAKLIREEVSATFGDWGVGRLGGAGAGGVSVKYLSPATSTAIIRCPRASYRLVWTALTYMSHVPEVQTSYSSSRSEGRRRTTTTNVTAGGSALERGQSMANLTRPCVFRVIRVSGTMRKAEEEAIRRARREILRLKEVDEDVVLEGLVAASGQGQNLRGGRVGDGGAAFDVDLMDEDEDEDEDVEENVDMGGSDEA